MPISLSILKTRIELGLETPLRFLHVTDSHISRAYPEDGEETNWLAQERNKNCFDMGVPGQSERLFEEALDYGKQHNLSFIFTGDIYDFISKANFDALDKILSDCSYLYAAGNHDFCHYPGRDREDYSYKIEHLPTVQPHVKEYNLLFASKNIGGVNFIMMDDSYYLFTFGQLDLLKAEAAKGLPMVLLLHNPLYTEELAARVLSRQGCSYVVGCEEPILSKNPPERIIQQTPDEATKATVAFLRNEPLLKAIFAGHIHESFETQFSPTCRQYVTGATYRGEIREITIE